MASSLRSRRNDGSRVWTLIIVGIISVAILSTLFGGQRSSWSAYKQTLFGTTHAMPSHENHNHMAMADQNVLVNHSFFLLLGAGLLTGLSHCVGMCGPLVGAFALRRQKATPTSGRSDYTSSLVLFQSGRLLTYTILGVIAGALGGLVMVINLLRQWQGILSFGLGLILILMGLGLLGWLPTQSWFQSVAWTRWVGKQMQLLLKSEHPLGLLGLGMVNGLLPCGAIYAMSILAVSTGNPIQGATLMLIFGLGTLPAMLGLGLSIGALGLAIRKQLFQLTAIVVVILGVQLLLRGLALSNLVSHLSLGGVMLW